MSGSDNAIWRSSRSFLINDKATNDWLGTISSERRMSLPGLLRPTAKPSKLSLYWFSAFLEPAA
jgi:hypothetical protein